MPFSTQPDPALRLDDFLKHFELQATIKDGRTIHPSDSRNGNRTEKWTQVRAIGRGTYGLVWLEGQKMSGETRAVKQVPKWVQMDHLKEIRAIAKFSKYPEYFAKFFGWYADEHAYYLAMEYVEHGSLFDYMKNSAAAFPEEEVKEVVSQLLGALRYMHQHDYAHRDLKPGNVFISSPRPQWRVKLGDFGISKRTTEDTVLQTTGVYSQAYCAPEMRGFVRDRCETDNYVYTSLVDIWSLGVIGFEMLAKKRPFPKTADVVSYYDGEAGFPAEELMDVPVSPACVDFLAMLLQPRPSARPTAIKALESPWLESCQCKEAVSEDEASEETGSETSKTTLKADEDDQRSFLGTHDGLRMPRPGLPEASQGSFTVHPVGDNTRSDLLSEDRHEESRHHEEKEHILRRTSFPAVEEMNSKNGEWQKSNIIFDPGAEDSDEKRKRLAEEMRMDEEEGERIKTERKREDEGRQKRHEARRLRRAEVEQNEREEEEREKQRAVKKAVARRAEEMRKQYEEENARDQRHRERKQRERERKREIRFSAVEANDLPVPDAFPSPTIEAEELCERGPNVPPAAPRPRHTDGLSKRTRDPSPPKRQSLIMGLFGRSNTTPIILQNKDRDSKGKKPERESRDTSDTHRSRRQRTPSEEEAHRRRKAERRASRAGDYPPTPPAITAAPAAVSPEVLPMNREGIVPEALPSPVDELPSRRSLDGLFEYVAAADSGSEWSERPRRREMRHAHAHRSKKVREDNHRDRRDQPVVLRSFGELSSDDSSSNRDTHERGNGLFDSLRKLVKK